MSATLQCAHPWERACPVRRAEGERSEERLVVAFGVLAIGLDDGGIVMRVMKEKVWRAYWWGIEVKRPASTRRRR